MGTRLCAAAWEPGFTSKEAGEETAVGVAVSLPKVLSCADLSLRALSSWGTSPNVWNPHIPHTGLQCNGPRCTGRPVCALPSLFFCQPCGRVGRRLLFVTSVTREAEVSGAGSTVQLCVGGRTGLLSQTFGT